MAIIWVGTGRFNAYIGPVQDYIDRVVAADVAAGNTLGLEVGVRDAYDVFIRDSINVGDLGTSGGVLSQANSIIKAAPIMAGARTLPGCLVPLVGTAPTRFGTEGGWNYNRRTGLAGNGTDNYLNSNRNNNADPQNSRHAAVYASTRNTETAVRAYIRATFQAGVGATQILSGAVAQKISSRCSDATTATSSGNLHSSNGFLGTSRSLFTSYTARGSGISETITQVSAAPGNGNYFVFAGNNQDASIVDLYSNARLSFYSIGESLNLTLLDTRLTTLMAAIAAAIP
jgi:hypothetical protein